MPLKSAGIGLTFRAVVDWDPYRHVEMYRILVGHPLVRFKILHKPIEYR